MAPIPLSKNKALAAVMFSIHPGCGKLSVEPIMVGLSIVKLKLSGFLFYSILSQ